MSEGLVLMLASFEPTEHGHVVRWKLKRSHRLTPMQLVSLVAATLMLGGTAALLLWGVGEGLLAGILLLALALVEFSAFRYVRHACDQETVTVHRNGLLVERDVCGASETVAFQLPEVRLEDETDDAALICISEGARRARVGRFVGPQIRRQAMAEIRKILSVADLDQARGA